ncbi:MAG: hypothetical protein EHM79_15195 [Geobacter sp.]|nr:MAG: hypothetical protein EHM79_15195 [Geobacter sp.]
MRNAAKVFMKMLLFSAVCSCIPVVQASAAQPSAKSINSTVIISDTKYGPASVLGKDSEFYYLKVKIKAKSATAFSFKQTGCVLSDSGGRKFSTCWIAITGGSAGLSFSNSAPIVMSIFDATTGDTFIKLSASKVDGPNGEIGFQLPKDGFVDICFLWPVPKGFKSVKVKLAGIADIALINR